MRIRGIPLRVHPSWFAILLLFTWISQGQISSSIQPPSLLMSWFLGLLTSLLLFFSVLLHELGHSFAALNEGVKVRSITLFLMGGVAKVERECSTPMAALRVAIAGPLVSLFLAIILLGSVQLTSEMSPLLSQLVSKLGSLNLVLGLFNLLPGLPLDGGLILKALVWQWTGSQRKGLKVALTSGRFLSFLSIGLGIWSLFFMKGPSVGGLWLVMLGWFGLTASRSEAQMLTLQKALCDLNVGKATGRGFRVLEDDQTLRRLSQLRMVEGENSLLSEWVLVCSSGRWVGYVTDKPLKELPVQQWDQQRLADHLQPLDDLPSISEKSPLWEAVIALEESKAGKLLVYNLAGLPCGTIDRIRLGEAVLRSIGLKLPSSLLEAARSQDIYPLGIALPQVVESMVASGLVKYSNDSSDS